MTDLADDLTERLVGHIQTMSVTLDERAIADEVAAWADGLGAPVVRVGNSLVVGELDTTRPTVGLVGHLDVVPPTDDDREPRVEERAVGAVVVGRGASDMKSGNIVAMKLFEQSLGAGWPHAVVVVLYAAEEGPAADNELPDLLREVPWLTELSLAIVLEPTDGELQLGCLGGLHATLTVRGQQAHSARPWQGVNALTRAGRFLAAFHEREPLDVEVDGIGYRDVWSFTQASTSNARNVVPGSFELNLNLRFAPSRTLAEATDELRAVVAEVAAATDAGEVEVEIIDEAIPAPPRGDDPIVIRLRDTLGVPVAGKQAWTDVARLVEAGIPAGNFGPGRTDQAHQRGEWVSVEAMVEAYNALLEFLSTPP